MVNMLVAADQFEAESSQNSTGGMDIARDIRFEPETYDRFVNVTAFGTAAFSGNAANNKGQGDYAGIVVERLEGGSRKNANQSYEARSSSITFFASVTEAFFVPKGEGRVLTFQLRHQSAIPTKAYFTKSTLRLKHATLKLT